MIIRRRHRNITGPSVGESADPRNSDRRIGVKAGSQSAVNAKTAGVDGWQVVPCVNAAGGKKA
jgi:hypothetical protein